MTLTTDVSTPGDTDIVAVRRFRAPAAAVWAAHVEPEHVRRWMALPDSPMLVCDIDLRVGGSYRYAWSMPDGSAFGFTGTYREIDAPHRLVSTEVYQPSVPADGGEPAASGDAPTEAVNTMELTEDAGTTTLRLTMRYPNSDVRDAVMASGMTGGMSACLDALESLLAQGLVRA